MEENIKEQPTEKLMDRQEDIWEEMQQAIEGIGIASLIQELLELERELTIREEQPK